MGNTPDGTARKCVLLSPGSHQMEETKGHPILEGLGLASQLLTGNVFGDTELEV